MRDGEVPPSGVERRARGLVRVPFVHRCELAFDDGRRLSAFFVNINVLGGYIADDLDPDAMRGNPARGILGQLGQRVAARFRVAGIAEEIAVSGTVIWVNSRQNHPVHSLPPGFGLRFENVTPEAQAMLTAVIDDYVSRHPNAR